MMDHTKCPARTVVDDTPGREEFARCEVIRGHLGWDAQVGASVCRQCAEAGDAATSNPKIDGLLTHLMRVRVFDVANPYYPASRTPEALLRELREQGRVKDNEEALELLDEAVRRGLAPEEATRIAREAGIDAA